LKIIPVVNKIDLPNSDREKTAEEIMKAFGFEEDEIFYASGKTGEGVEKILEAVVAHVPAPTGKPDQPLRALIFDSTYDQHRGVVTFVRVSGWQTDEKMPKNPDAGHENFAAEALEVGFFHPEIFPIQRITNWRSRVHRDRPARCSQSPSRRHSHEYANSAVEALPGYKQVKPMVYASIFPTSGDDYPLLRDAIDKLKLNDAALEFEPESIPALGLWFPHRIFGFAAYGYRAGAADPRIWLGFGADCAVG
jgi:GTP-binding protein LepA